MSELSGDEILVLIASVVGGGIFWLRWFAELGTGSRCAGTRERRLLTAGPFLCAALLGTVLLRLAASDVRNDAMYLFFYLSLGAAWLILGLSLLPYLGLSVRDDALERRNPAAAAAIVGAQLGLTLCFAGGNIGEGPGWWVVVFSAALATAVFLLLWVLLDRFTGLVDTITIDRDLAAGFRLAGFFVGAGLILGRAVAGDWHSAPATIADFAAKGWPVLPLWLAAVLIERALRPSPALAERPVLRDGLLPALLYAGAGAAGVVLAGPWS